MGRRKYRIKKRRPPREEVSKKPWIGLLREDDSRRIAAEKKGNYKKKTKKGEFFSFERQRERLRKATFNIEESINKAIAGRGYEIQDEITKKLIKAGIHPQSQKARKRLLDERITKEIALLFNIRHPSLIIELKKAVKEFEKKQTI